MTGTVTITGREVYRGGRTVWRGYHVNASAGNGPVESRNFRQHKRDGVQTWPRRVDASADAMARRLARRTGAPVDVVLWVGPVNKVLRTIQPKSPGTEPRQKGH